LIQRCDPLHGQEQPMSILQDDRLPHRTVLVLLELEFPQVIVRLLPSIGLNAFEVLPESERPLPGGRA
jgi:hypothetical protein